jgi:hypothetical protein
MDKIIQHNPGGTMAKQHPVGDSIQEMKRVKKRELVNGCPATL